jgi:transcriptional regulator with XRE-family HTH domain
MKININLLFSDAKYRGDCLVYLRKSKGYKQKDLAKMLDMKAGTIWAWEKGTVDFTMGKFGQVLSVLDINILEYIDTDYVTTDDLIEIKVFWKFVQNLMKNKQWINNGKEIEESKLGVYNELVKLICDYTEKL